MTPRTRVFVPAMAAVVALALAGPAPCRAGRPAAAPDSAATAGPRSGLAFLVQQDFTLGAVDGATLNFRRRGLDGHGWRCGVDAHGSYDRTVERGENPNFAYVVTTRRQVVAAGTSVQRLVESHGRHGLSSYWAAGPDAGYSVDRTWTHGAASMGYPLVERLSSWYGGVAACLGAECLVADRLSLTAEYGVEARYSWTRVESLRLSQIGTDTQERSFSLEARTVRLGVTAWFR